MSFYPGGGGPLQVATFTLTSAQVLSIFTTPVNIIPAQGPGNMIVPLSLVFNYTYRGTAYTDGGGNLVAGFGGDGIWQFATAGFWNQTTSQMVIDPLATTGIVPLTVANLPLTISHTVGNPTLGNGTVTITVAYTVVAVA